MVLSFLVTVLPVIAIMSAIIYLPYLWYSNRRIGKQNFSYHFIRYTFLGYLLSLIFITILWGLPFYSFPPQHYFLNLRPFVWLYEVYDMGVKKMAEQLLLNIGMFIPYGLLLPMLFQKMHCLYKTALTILSSIIFIETVQYFLGRSADIDDVIMNFTGGLLGYFLYTLWGKLQRTK